MRTVARNPARSMTLWSTWPAAWPISTPTGSRAWWPSWPPMAPG